jgi:hypothetical protein
MKRLNRSNGVLSIWHDWKVGIGHTRISATKNSLHTPFFIFI